MSLIANRKNQLTRALGAALLTVALVSMAPAALAQRGGGHSGGGGHFAGGGGHSGGGHWGGGGWGGRGWGWGGWGWGVGLGVGLWGWPYYWDWPYDYGAYSYYPPSYYTAQAPAAAPVQLAPQSQSWYYCASPKGYYPYVQNCAGPWRPVPATPPGAP